MEISKHKCNNCGKEKKSMTDSCDCKKKVKWKHPYKTRHLKNDRNKKS
jgi:hypothetical protein